jgi:hypothetical protein
MLALGTGLPTVLKGVKSFEEGLAVIDHLSVFVILTAGIGVIVACLAHLKVFFLFLFFYFDFLFELVSALFSSSFL